jgi:hypothetical protein
MHDSREHWQKRGVAWRSYVRSFMTDLRKREKVWYTNTSNKKPREDDSSQAVSMRLGNLTADVVHHHHTTPHHVHMGTSINICTAGSALHKPGVHTSDCL